MCFDLRDYFKPVTQVPADTGPITTLVVDVFDTLVIDGKIVKDVEDFVLKMEDEGTEIILASQTHSPATDILQKKGSKNHSRAM